jgi:hypothetical protein
MNSKNKMIPEEELYSAFLDATTPAKKMTRSTVEIYALVRLLKESRKNEESNQAGEDAWGFLQKFFSIAIHERDYTMFDEFATAWKLPDGEEQKLRRPKTAAIVDCVKSFQDYYGRTPTRQEILDTLAESDLVAVNQAMDDTELCRQLKALGWQDLIPKSRGLAS